MNPSYRRCRGHKVGHRDDPAGTDQWSISVHPPGQRRCGRPGEIRRDPAGPMVAKSVALVRDLSSITAAIHAVPRQIIANEVDQLKIRKPAGGIEGDQFREQSFRIVSFHFRDLKDLPRRRKQAPRLETVHAARKHRAEAGRAPRTSRAARWDRPTSPPANRPPAKEPCPLPALPRHAEGQPRRRPSILREELCSNRSARCPWLSSKARVISPALTDSPEDFRPRHSRWDMRLSRNSERAISAEHCGRADDWEQHQLPPSYHNDARFEEVHNLAARSCRSPSDRGQAVQGWDRSHSGSAPRRPPLSHCAQRLATAILEEATATPTIPVSGQRAAMDIVILAYPAVGITAVTSISTSHSGRASAETTTPVETG